MNDFEIRGSWWLPHDKDRKISGTLRFHLKSEITLELDGNFDTSTNMKLSSFEIIHGESSEERYITLYVCFEKYKKTSSSSILVNNIFIGKLFNKPEDIKFAYVRISYEHLDKWVSGYRFKTIWKRPYSVKHTPPRAFSVMLPSINARLKLHHKVSVKRDTISSCELNHEDFLELRPKKEQNLEWYTEKLHAIRVFLVLLIGGVIKVQSLTGFGSVTHKIGKITLREQIEIYRIPVDIKLDEVAEWDIIFNLPALRDNIKNYLDKWCSDFQLLDPVYDLFLPIMSRHSMYHETIFLNLTEVIEAFHRRIYDDLYLDENDYSPICNLLIKTIPKNTPKDLRESLKSRLVFGNEFSLRTRLKRLLEGPIWDECLSQFIKDKNAFINTVVNTRNYYVHYDKKSETLALTPRKGLGHCNNILTLILFVLLYEHVGMPVKTIFEAVKYRGRFKSYLLAKRNVYYANRLDKLEF